MMVAALPASAAPMNIPVKWTDWISFTKSSEISQTPPSVDKGSALGTLAGIEVRYTGEVSYNPSSPEHHNQGTIIDGTFTNWTPVDIFGGELMSPNTQKDIIGIQGFYTGVNTIDFCKPGSDPCIPVYVHDPYFAIWSLGAIDQPNQRFDFIGMTPNFVVGGDNGFSGGRAITVIGNSVYGTEGSGIVQFYGNYSQLKWTDTKVGTVDNYGFTVGLVPEPATLFLFAIGLAAMGLTTTRRNQRGKAQ